MLGRLSFKIQNDNDNDKEKFSLQKEDSKIRSVQFWLSRSSSQVSNGEIIIEKTDIIA